MLTEHELVYQIATGKENVIFDDDTISVETPQIKMRNMMIHNALIHKLNTRVLQINEIDWSSFMDSIFEMNHGLDFIKRVKNKQLKTKILNYWIGNYDEIVGNEWRKDLWTSEWKDLL